MVMKETELPGEASVPAQQVRGSVLVLIPAKNEAEGIVQTIRSVPADAIRAAGYDLDIMVVDGNSSDETVDLAQAEGATVIRRNGRGKGRDFRQVLGHVQTDFLVMIDGDGTYPAEQIPEMLHHVTNGSDVVMGSRFRQRGSLEPGSMTLTNRFGNRALSLMASTLYGKRTTDVCTGMWAFKREALSQLYLNAEKFELEAELFAQSVKAGLKVDEVPIAYRVRHGDSKLGGVKAGLRIGAKLVRKRLVR